MIILWLRRFLPTGASRQTSRYNFGIENLLFVDVHMKSLIFPILVVCVTCQASFGQSAPGDDSVRAAVAKVTNVGFHGAGHSEAVEAMKVLNAASAEQIPMLFEAFGESNAISANWLRASIQKAVDGNDSLPVDTIKAYFADQSKSAKGRWLAWQIICKKDPEFRASSIDALVDDASMPLREVGIAKLISDANALGVDAEKMDASAKEKKSGILKTALEHARDVDQVRSIAKSLKPLGMEVDLRKQLGFLCDWHFVAGFDNKEQAGFDVLYQPEAAPDSPDLKQTFTVGQKQASWEKTVSEHETGVVDFNEVVGKEKGVIVYASSVFKSAGDTDAEVRIGTPNAHKIWVNGELVMSNEIYHNSNSIDKFSAPVKLRAGNNSVLLKLCQNEQTQPWAQDWSFQLRFCDASGKPVERAQ
jgi:hypothetical protein